MQMIKKKMEVLKFNASCSLILWDESNHKCECDCVKNICKNKTLPKSPQTYNVPCITRSKKYVYLHVSVSCISIAQLTCKS